MPINYKLYCKDWKLRSRFIGTLAEGEGNEYGDGYGDGHIYGECNGSGIGYGDGILGSGYGSIGDGMGWDWSD